MRAHATEERQLEALLLRLGQKQIKLWAQDGRLAYRAPKGAVEKADLDALRQYRGELVAHLERSGVSKADDPLADLRMQQTRVPPTYAQLAHWNSYGLRNRPAMRQIASVTRLRGQLQLKHLERSILDQICRHDALRTRMSCIEDRIIQDVSVHPSWDLETDDISALAKETREIEIGRQINELILQPINISSDPLFGARLLTLQPDDHLLLIALEHSISDMTSVSILLRDTVSAYEQMFAKRTAVLPSVPVQYSEYAIQQSFGRESLLKKNEVYWKAKLMGHSRLRFPADRVPPQDARPGWASVPVRIGREPRRELLEWCRANRTTLPMAVFTAYAALVLRWCDSSEAIIRYQSDGRVSPKIGNTIGFFAAALYIPVCLDRGDRFVDLLRQVTSEYCEMYEHADQSYLAAQVPRPEFTRNTLFNWVPRSAGSGEASILGGSRHSLTLSPVRFAHPILKELKLDCEPQILLHDTGEEIVGDVLFAAERFSRGLMGAFATSLDSFLKVLSSDRERPISSIKINTWES